VIGTSLLTVRAYWRGPRRTLLPRSGPNGPDLQILGVLTRENVAAHHSELALLSGGVRLIGVHAGGASEGDAD
jgi:hypothetical protein